GDIDENLTDAKLRSLKFFIPSTYKDKKGETRKCYLLTKQGCEFVANKMTGKKGNQFTAAYVTLFNKMEAAVQTPKYYIPKTYSEALQLATDQAKQLELQQPKVDYYDSQMRNPGLMTTTEIAKDYGKTAAQLNQLLHAAKVIYKQGKKWVLYKDFSGKGYAQYEPYSYNENKGLRNLLKWTQKGKKLIYDILKDQYGILPDLEARQLEETNLF
ncbi:MAG: phage regulatory protein/antirepressor Ant, partial [Bacilli bacterium]|nr:phage regulatory protein/antirepressor Ant [Bacilli bacterium]